MKRGVAQTVVAAVAAVMIILVSIFSASMIAPERGDEAKLAFTLAYGSSVEDLCGPGSETHDHRCPFCRLLADAPTTQPSDVATILRPHDGWRRLADLTRKAQGRDYNHPARAPPARA